MFCTHLHICTTSSVLYSVKHNFFQTNFTDIFFSFCSPSSVTHIYIYHSVCSKFLPFPIHRLIPTKWVADEDSGLLGYDPVSLGEWPLMSPRIIRPSSSMAVQTLSCTVLGDKGTLFLQNITNHLHDDTWSHPRRPGSSATLLWEPHIFEYHILWCLNFKMWDFTEISEQICTLARIPINNYNHRICSL